MLDVLVVEDHFDSADALITALRHAGYPVRHAVHGEAALSALSENPPGLIVLDLRLPVMNGIEFLKVVRSYRRWRPIPVVVVTAASDHELAPLTSLGVTHVFQKPSFNLAAFVETCRELLPVDASAAHTHPYAGGPRATDNNAAEDRRPAS